MSPCGSTAIEFPQYFGELFEGLPTPLTPIENIWLSWVLAEVLISTNLSNPTGTAEVIIASWLDTRKVVYKQLFAFIEKYL